MTADVALTVDEACEVLDPPVDPQQLRDIIRALGWQRTGVRLNGHVGRPPATAWTYDATQIMRLHAALLPFIHVSGYDLPSRPDCPDASMPAITAGISHV